MHATGDRDSAFEWLEQVPLAALVADQTGTVRWVNLALEKLLGLTRNQLVGHDVVSLPSETHRVLLGDEELIYLNGPGVKEHWLRCLHSTGGPEDRLTYRFYQDVTREMLLEHENTRLRKQVEGLQLTDELTGLPNRKAMRQHLELQVSRSRRYGNPLSVILVRLSNAQDHAKLDQRVLATSQYLRDRLRWVDQIARWDEWSFLVVLPETGNTEAGEVEDNLLASPDALRLSHESANDTIEFHCAHTSWQRGDDARSLLKRIEQSLEEAESAGSTG